MYLSPSPSPSDLSLQNRSPYRSTYVSITQRCTPALSPSCAFPSWPRRSSLTGAKNCQSDPSQIPDSFITDEELFLEPSSHEREFHTSSSSSICQSFVSPSRAEPMIHQSSQPRRDVSKSDRDIIRELVQLEKAKKAARKNRKGLASSKKTRTTSGGSKYMSPIME
ncbi:hypothetical protein K3495_g9561 [Podosphaera aphanis]|nr:hypothetical protein K3495_g9561 [Podosphaera aphanis]